MKKSIINLYLNETGKKALNTDIKVLNVNEAKENINDQYVENIFPLALVDRYEVQDSFLSLECGEYVIVAWADGTKYLGKVGGTYRNQIDVTIYRTDYPYPDSRQFNPTGIEATHCKNKAHLELADEKTVANMKRAIENKPFVEFLKAFNENQENIKFDPEQIILPEWLNINVINQLNEVIDEAKGYDHDREF